MATYTFQTEQAFNVTLSVEADTVDEAWEEVLAGRAFCQDQQPSSIIGTLDTADRQLMAATMRNIIAMLDLQADRVLDDTDLIDSFDDGPYEAAMNRTIDHQESLRAIREVHARHDRRVA